MYDIHVMLPDNPGTLGLFGCLMGRAGVSLEGGGMFTLGGAGHAHFLVEDGAAAADAGLPPPPPPLPAPRILRGGFGVAAAPPTRRVWGGRDPPGMGQDIR